RRRPGGTDRGQRPGSHAAPRLRCPHQLTRSPTVYRTAFRDVLAHKGRLLMTMLAVLLGTAFVAGTLTFSDSIERSVENRMSGNTQGANWVPSQDPEFPMVQGTGPTAAGMIAIDRRTASDNNFKVGDTVRAAVNGPVLEMTVTGIFTTDDPHVRAGGSLVLFDTATAKHPYLQSGRYDTIQVIAKPGTSQEEFGRDVLRVAPDDG